MWLLGFFLHEMAFGLLSIFLPLYITGAVGGTLVDVGVMTSLATSLAIPFSFFWLPALASFMFSSFPAQFSSLAICSLDSSRNSRVRIVVGKSLGVEYAFSCVIWGVTSAVFEARVGALD